MNDADEHETRTGDDEDKDGRKQADGDIDRGAFVIDGDSDSDDPSRAIVLAVTNKTINEVKIPGTNETVADYNPTYDADEPAVVVAFEDDMESWNGWREADPATLQSSAVARDIRTYTYPAARLVRADGPAHSTTANADDRDAVESADAAPTSALDPDDDRSRSTLPETVGVWFDGACEPRNPGGHGTFGIVVEDDDGMTLVTDRGYIGEGADVTNNVAEYTGLIKALEYIHDRNPDAHVAVHGDSQLAIRQMTGRYRVRSDRLRPLWHQAQTLARDLDVSFEWVPREHNEHADSLSRREYHERVHGDEIADRKQRAQDELDSDDVAVAIRALPDRGPRIFEVKTQYIVDLDTRTCTCPDFENRGLPCKHIFEAELHTNHER